MLALSQVVIFFNSLFKQVMRFSRYLPLNSTHVSSAYSTVNSNSDTFKMSLVNMIKRRGPKIEPVELHTREKMCPNYYHHMQHTEICLRGSFQNHFNMLPLMPYAYVFRMVTVEVGTLPNDWIGLHAYP